MPTRPPHPCHQPGCPALISDGPYCPAHQRAEQQRYDQARGNAASRGYDAAWRRFRAWYIQRHPICDECVSPTKEIHHVIAVEEAPELRLVESNCQPKCKMHHSMITAREQSFGRRRAK